MIIRAPIATCFEEKTCPRSLLCFAKASWGNRAIHSFNNFNKWVVVKIGVPVWVYGTYSLGCPKRDPNFDNHPSNQGYDKGCFKAYDKGFCKVSCNAMSGTIRVDTQLL